MRIDIRDSKYSIIYNEKTGTVEDVLWCNESAEGKSCGRHPRLQDLLATATQQQSEEADKK